MPAQSHAPYPPLERHPETGLQNSNDKEFNHSLVPTAYLAQMRAEKRYLHAYFNQLETSSTDLEPVQCHGDLSSLDVTQDQAYSKVLYSTVQNIVTTSTWRDTMPKPHSSQPYQASQAPQTSLASQAFKPSQAYQKPHAAQAASVPPVSQAPQDAQANLAPHMQQTGSTLHAGLAEHAAHTEYAEHSGLAHIAASAQMAQNTATQALTNLSLVHQYFANISLAYPALVNSNLTYPTLANAALALVNTPEQLSKPQTLTHSQLPAQLRMPSADFPDAPPPHGFAPHHANQSVTSHKVAVIQDKLCNEVTGSSYPALLPAQAQSSRMQVNHQATPLELESRAQHRVRIPHLLHALNNWCSQVSSELPQFNIYLRPDLSTAWPALAPVPAWAAYSPQKASNTPHAFSSSNTTGVFTSSAIGASSVAYAFIPFETYSPIEVSNTDKDSQNAVMSCVPWQQAVLNLSPYAHHSSVTYIHHQVPTSNQFNQFIGWKLKIMNSHLDSNHFEKCHLEDHLLGVNHIIGDNSAAPDFPITGATNAITATTTSNAITPPHFFKPIHPFNAPVLWLTFVALIQQPVPGTIASDLPKSRSNGRNTMAQTTTQDLHPNSQLASSDLLSRKDPPMVIKPASSSLLDAKANSDLLDDSIEAAQGGFNNNSCSFDDLAVMKLWFQTYDPDPKPLSKSLKQLADKMGIKITSKDDIPPGLSPCLCNEPDNLQPVKPLNDILENLAYPQIQAMLPKELVALPQAEMPFSPQLNTKQNAMLQNQALSPIQAQAQATPQAQAHNQAISRAPAPSQSLPQAPTQLQPRVQTQEATAQNELPELSQLGLSKNELPQDELPQPHALSQIQAEALTLYQTPEIQARAQAQTCTQAKTYTPAQTDTQPQKPSEDESLMQGKMSSQEPLLTLEKVKTQVHAQNQARLQAQLQAQTHPSASESEQASESLYKLPPTFDHIPCSHVEQRQSFIFRTILKNHRELQPYMFLLSLLNEDDPAHPAATKEIFKDKFTQAGKKAQLVKARLRKKLDLDPPDSPEPKLESIGLKLLNSATLVNEADLAQSELPQYEAPTLSKDSTCLESAAPNHARAKGYTDDCSDSRTDIRAVSRTNLQDQAWAAAWDVNATYAAQTTLKALKACSGSTVSYLQDAQNAQAATATPNASNIPHALADEVSAHPSADSKLEADAGISQMQTYARQLRVDTASRKAGVKNPEAKKNDTKEPKFFKRLFNQVRGKNKAEIKQLNLQTVLGAQRQNLLLHQLRRNLTLFSLTLMSLAIGFVAVGGLIYQSSQSQLVPYVVTVDSHGVVLNQGTAAPSSEVPKQVVTAQLCDFIRSVRIITSDQQVQQQSILKAYAFVRPGSNVGQQLNSYYTELNPFEKAKTKEIHINIANAIEVGDNTYQIDWLEQLTPNSPLTATSPSELADLDLNSSSESSTGLLGSDKSQRGFGQVTNRRMRAIISYSVQPTNQTSADDLLLNPLGIFVEKFTVSQILG